MGKLLSLVHLNQLDWNMFRKGRGIIFLTDIHEIHSTQHNFKTIGSILTKFVLHILDSISNCILPSNTSSNLS